MMAAIAVATHIPEIVQSNNSKISNNGGSRSNRQLSRQISNSSANTALLSPLLPGVCLSCD